MKTIQNLQDNLHQAEDWVRRLRKWSERLESHPTLLAMISVLKYIPANGAQAARRKLESLLEEFPRTAEEVSIQGESSEHPESYHILLENNYSEITIETRKNHRILLAGDSEKITIDHGPDESKIFYPRLREKICKNFDVTWPENKNTVIESTAAIRVLFSSELERARSTLRWASQEQDILLS
ncbi:MAG: hypothetical protein ACLFN5_06395 [bacterium]